MITRNIIYTLGGAAGAVRHMKPFIPMILNKRGIFVPIDGGIDRVSTINVPGIGLLDIATFLPGNVRTVGDLFRYVESAKLPDDKATPLIARIEKEMHQLTELPDKPGDDRRTFVQKAERQPLDKGAFARPAFARVVYESSRPLLQPKLVENFSGMLLADKETGIGSEGQYEYELLVILGLGGGFGAGFENYFPEDAKVALLIAQNDLVSKDKLSSKAKVSVNVTRLGIGYLSYPHIRNSDGHILKDEKDIIFNACTAKLMEMQQNGHSAVVLNEQGTALGPALYHLIEIAPKIDRLGINDATDGGTMPAYFFSSRTVTEGTLSRLTRQFVYSYEGTHRSGLLVFEPGQEGVGVRGIRVGKKPRAVGLDGVEKIGNRRQIALEYKSVRNEDVDDFARRNGLTVDEKRAAAALLEQHRAYLEAVMDALPEDLSGRLYVADFERALQQHVLNLPLKLEPKHFEELPIYQIEYGESEGVFFPNRHRTHERGILRGLDGDGSSYVLSYLIERGYVTNFLEQKKLNVFSLS